MVPLRNAAGQPMSGPCTDQMPTAAAVSATNAPAAPAAPLPELPINAASAASETAPSSSGSAPCQWRSPQCLACRAFTCYIINCWLRRNKACKKKQAKLGNTHAHGRRSDNRRGALHAECRTALPSAYTHTPAVLYTTTAMAAARMLCRPAKPPAPCAPPHPEP